MSLILSHRLAVDDSVHTMHHSKLKYTLQYNKPSSNTSQFTYIQKILSASLHVLKAHRAAHHFLCLRHSLLSMSTVGLVSGDFGGPHTSLVALQTA